MGIRIIRGCLVYNPDCKCHIIDDATDSKMHSEPILMHLFALLEVDNLPKINAVIEIQLY